MRRNDQKFIGGVDNPDLSLTVEGQPVHVEVKRCERLSLYEAMEQAEHDANGHALPVVVHRRNRKPWLVVLRLEDMLRTLGYSILNKERTKRNRAQGRASFRGEAPGAQGVKG